MTKWSVSTRIFRKFKIKGLAFYAVILTICCISKVAQGQRFNYEIEQRIRERLDFFLSGPTETARVLVNFRRNGGFPNQMQAADRDLFLTLAYSVPQPLVYVGLEDGTCPGYYWSNGYYREPGNSGYPVDDLRMKKHLNSCIDGQTGESKQCLLPPGTDYILCEGGGENDNGLCPQLELCPNQPKPDISIECNVTGSSEADGATSCDSEIQDVKWCRQYSIAKAPESIESTGLGYIPITNFCHNDKGQFTQKTGTVIDPSRGDRESTERINCTYGNGSLVQRTLAGNYSACGPGKSCDTVFAGGYTSSEYDPRYRPWYIQVKELQKPVWLPPYPFFTLGLGVTYAEPIYSIDNTNGKKIFAGVVAVDYRLEDIASFLVESYGGTDSAVIIHDAVAPYYVIAASTGSPSSRFVLSSDPSQPCPVERGDSTGCEPVRTEILNFGETLIDAVLVQAAILHEEKDYPESLLTVKAPDNSDDKFYASQSTIYEQEGTNLFWRVVVVEPGLESSSDTITRGKQLFPVIVAIGSIGCSICTILLIVMYKRRGEKAIVLADWRFTCAFIFGCILFNSSTFTLLGENTEEMCLLRMWSFNLTFVMTLSPLLVKVWRMYQLVGSTSIRRNSITNIRAAMYTIPMVLVQVIFLSIFTVIDPPRPFEYIEEDGDAKRYGVICSTDTNAYFFVMASYEFFFVLVGCGMAYITRNMKDEFGEAKQMIFSMYNIFFVGILFVVAYQTMSLTSNEESVLQAIGVFWITVFSAAAFVVPRLLQAESVRKERLAEKHFKNVTVSGVNPEMKSVQSSSDSLNVIEENKREDDASGFGADSAGTRVNFVGALVNDGSSKI